MDPNQNSKKKQKQHASSDTNDSGHEGSDTTSTATLTPVEAMTSRDFHLDYNAHVEMMNQVLKDTVRIDNFKAAIMHNKHLFKGKCVLNIGCGTGIFALFAAKAGAAKVFAVDSSNVVYYTRQIVQANGYAEVIKVIKGKIEEVELPVAEVDIIVCDWMGYALLFQSICDSVIFARDKWLKKPGGLIFPDQGKLYMVALEDTKHKNGNINWWSNVYGFNMRCLREVALIEPRYQSIRPDQIMSKQFPIKSLNLNTATLDDLKFRSKFMLPIHKSGYMDGIALYFHVYFTKSHTPLGFSTDPWSPRTNWLQTILFFDQSLPVNSGSLYYGGIEFAPKPGNLNDIVVNLEMLMGDPTQADIEMEMSWHFKLSTAAAAGPVQTKTADKKIAKTIKKPNTEENLSNNNKQDSKMCPDKPKVPQNSKNSTANTLTDQKSILCSGLVVTTDNLNNTITIGKHEYPCRKNKRNKSKYPKKG
ncbi:protein arginine N-methyltransferase 1-B-like [Calliphora vicina]|uniref:protein arginine N-methyltransferase 1-B-like n=1 Tax=Calliphora vicina TaxID=7373 RepID=UPI00325C0740